MTLGRVTSSGAGRVSGIFLKKQTATRLALYGYSKIKPGTRVFIRENGLGGAVQAGGAGICPPH